MTIEVEFIDAETGKLSSKKVEEPPMSFFDAVRSEQWTDRQIETFIDRLDAFVEELRPLAA